jgi:MFS family permease
MVVRTGVRTTIGAATSSVLFGMPLYLSGSLAVLMRADLGFDEAQLGTAFTLFFLVGAVVSVPGGALSERVGPRRAMVVGGLGSVLALVGIATLADTYGEFLSLLLFAGVANGLSQPATNLAIADGVPALRHGLAFGLKQSAGPASTLLAGLVVPLVVLVGWRWAFGGAGLLWLLVVVALPAIPSVPGRQRSPFRARPSADAPLATLVLLAAGATFAMAAAACLSAFLVSASVQVGMDVSAAGLLFAGGSVSSILVRVSAGWLADRRDGGHLFVVTGMLLLGALGYTLLAFGANRVFLVAGTILAFGAGWGWTGLHNFAVVRGSPGAPGVATAVTQTGILLGGVLGPVVFGFVVVRAGYQMAWFGAAVFSVTAALLTVLGRLRMRRDGLSASRPLSVA